MLLMEGTIISLDRYMFSASYLGREEGGREGGREGR